MSDNKTLQSRTKQQDNCKGSVICQVHRLYWVNGRCLQLILFFRLRMLTDMTYSDGNVWKLNALREVIVSNYPASAMTDCGKQWYTAVDPEQRFRPQFSRMWGRSVKHYNL